MNPCDGGAVSSRNLEFRNGSLGPPGVGQRRGRGPRGGALEGGGIGECVCQCECESVSVSEWASEG